MSAESPGQNEHYLRVYRRRFRVWRGSRPFWAGLLTMLGGVPIAYFPYASLKLGNLTLAMATTAGAGSLIIGVLLITLGFTMWFHHIVRVFAGVASIVLAMVSLPVSNIGGFVIGFLLSMLGGALSIAWVPAKPAAAKSDIPPEGDEPDSGPGHTGHPGHKDDAYATDTSVDANGGRNSAG